MLRFIPFNFDKFLLCLCFIFISTSLTSTNFFFVFVVTSSSSASSRVSTTFSFSSLVGVSCLVLLISSVLAFLAAISSSSSLMSPLLLDRLSSCQGLLNVGDGMIQELPISFFPVSLQPLSPFASSSSPDAILDQLVSHTPYAFQISAHHRFFLFPFSVQPATLLLLFFSSHHPPLHYVSWESVVELVLLGDSSMTLSLSSSSPFHSSAAGICGDRTVAASGGPPTSSVSLAQSR